MKANTSVEHSSGGVGFVGLLLLVFIVLKLTGVIEWSWWWVLAPLWIPLSVITLVFIVIVSYMLTIRERKARNRSKP